MALTYSAQVKTKQNDKSVTQTFNNMIQTIDTDEQISQFGSAYADLFSSDVTLTASVVIRKRTIAASND
ncbi:MAG: hypothetical protein IJ728_10745 [Selenomonadaceae bacterium]|nr:hypothetical protein [Selenomonadaceae bacterium]